MAALAQTVQSECLAREFTLVVSDNLDMDVHRS